MGGRTALAVYNSVVNGFERLARSMSEEFIDYIQRKIQGLITGTEVSWYYHMLSLLTWFDFSIGATYISKKFNTRYDFYLTNYNYNITKTKLYSKNIFLKVWTASSVVLVYVNVKVQVQVCETLLSSIFSSTLPRPRPISPSGHSSCKGTPWEQSRRTHIHNRACRDAVSCWLLDNKRFTVLRFAVMTTEIWRRAFEITVLN